jgi:tRNA dimethylallyltransferase
VDVRNPRRVARALEIVAAGRGDGAGPSEALFGPETRRPTLLVAVTRPREELRRRIAARVRRELEDGLVAELEAALEREDLSREAAQVIGMREVAAVRAGELPASELEERLRARTRRLARKQLTWLAKTPVAATLDLGEAPAAEALPRLLALWESARRVGSRP